MATKVEMFKNIEGQLFETEFKADCSSAAIVVSQEVRQLPEVPASIYKSMLAVFEQKILPLPKLKQIGLGWFIDK